MKHLPAFTLAILLTVAAPLHRLSAEEPKEGSAFGLTPAAKPESLLPESQGGLPLIPDAMPPLDKKDGKPEAEEKKSKTTAAEDALRDLIKLRVAKTKAQSDPGLQALWDSRLKARTDYEQREILTKYYTQLCERIAKIDKTLKKETIDTLKDRYLGMYDQSRIAPTQPPQNFRKP